MYTSLNPDAKAAQTVLYLYARHALAGEAKALALIPGQGPAQQVFVVHHFVQRAPW